MREYGGDIHFMSLSSNFGWEAIQFRSLFYYTIRAQTLFSNSSINSRFLQCLWWLNMYCDGSFTNMWSLNVFIYCSHYLSCE